MIEEINTSIQKERDVQKVLPTLHGSASDYKDMLDLEYVGGTVYLLPNQSHIRVCNANMYWSLFVAYIHDPSSNDTKRVRLRETSVDSLEGTFISILNRVHDELGAGFFDATIGQRLDEKYITYKPVAAP